MKLHTKAGDEKTKNRKEVALSYYARSMWLIDHWATALLNRYRAKGQEDPEIGDRTGEL